MKAITQYFRDSYQELEKVTWPTKQQVIDYTYLVIAVSVAVAVFLGGLDYFFGWVLSSFLL